MASERSNAALFARATRVIPGHGYETHIGDESDWIARVVQSGALRMEGR